MTGQVASAASEKAPGARAGAVAVVGMLVACGQAQAHGFGSRYDLPIPLSFYLAGAGLAVALSFVLLAFFMRSAPAAGHYRSIALPRLGWFVRTLCEPGLRLLGVGVFALVVVAGLFGTQSPMKNIAPIMVWAIWWVGMAYVCALLGDLWALANPFGTLFSWAEALWLRVGSARPLARGWRLPDAVGVWPAVALFLVFVWMEIVWPFSDSPAHLGAAILLYAAITWLGMLLFGRLQWLRHGEVFALVFGLLARFSPTEMRQSGDGHTVMILRPYGVGLLTREPVHVSMQALALAMLAAVSLDGFMETPLWQTVLAYYAPAPTDLSSDNEAARIWARTAAVLGAPLLFMSVYLVFCRLIAWAGQGVVPVARLAGLFVLTLVPIAVAYHVAHYLSFLVAAWQYLIPIASDPLGLGWDLFGTKNHFIRFGLIDARAVWYLSVAAIVLGHVIAVFLAHRIALQAYGDRRLAMRSQLPMMVLMVCYTMTSLWIIGQPIVTSR